MFMLFNRHRYFHNDGLWREIEESKPVLKRGQFSVIGYMGQMIYVMFKIN